VAVAESQLSNNPTYFSGEPWVVADPVNPQIVLATWTTIVDFTHPLNLLKATKNYCGVVRSTDGGNTWTSITQQSWGDQLGPVGDASLGVGPDGTFYLVCDLSVRSGTIVVIRSTDGGISWSLPVAAISNNQTPFYFDRPDLSVDPINGDVYLSATDDSNSGRAITVSTDHGSTWSTPVALDPDGQSNWGDTVTATGGIVAAAYVVDPTSSGYEAANPPAVTCASPCAVFETSGDHGVTWTRRIVTTNGVVVGNRAGQPRMGVASDPIQAGRYAVLVPTNADGTLELWLTDDSGVNWTQTKVLAAPTGETQAKWKLAYSTTGVLGIVWRTVHSDDTYDVQAIISADGGLTFGASIPLTQQPSAPSGIGDDCACNIYLNGTTLLTGWGDSRSGHREVWFGRYKVATE
jgi:hypothetical protein